MVIPEHHAHVPVSRHLRQLMRLKEVSEARSCLVAQVVEVQPVQTRTLASAIESLRYRVGLESKDLPVYVSRQAP